MAETSSHFKRCLILVDDPKSINTNTLDKVEDLVKFLGYTPRIWQYDTVPKYVMDSNIAIVVLANPTGEVGYDIKQLSDVLLDCVDKGIPILGLGDSTQAVLAANNIECHVIDDHIFDSSDVMHPIIMEEGDTLYLPSNHQTALIMPNDTRDVVARNMISETESPFIRVLGTSTSATYSKDVYEIAIAEIIAIPTLNYLGIFGSPELLFSRASYINMSNLVKRSLHRVEDLINDYLE